jgi:hypothetical protein
MSTVEDYLFPFYPNDSSMYLFNYICNFQNFSRVRITCSNLMKHYSGLKDAFIRPLNSAIPYGSKSKCHHHNYVAHDVMLLRRNN